MKRVEQKHIVQVIRKELEKEAEQKYRQGAERYFQEGITLHGVRSFKVRRISAKYYQVVKKKTKQEIFDLCETLLKHGYAEENIIAFDWVFRLQKQYAPSDFRIFESWLGKYVSNWGSCDDYCRHAFGAFVYQFPEFLEKLVKWTKSRNRWLRRGAAVILIYSLRKGKHLDIALRIADALILDDDYLVQNGYGWMLKDASILFPDEVYEYVMAHKAVMPRRALRYAIERFKPKQRRAAMAVNYQRNRS